MENRMGSRRSRLGKIFGLLGSTAAAAVALQATAEGTASGHVTTNPAYWFWDSATVAGTTTLVRTPQGVNFTYKTSNLTPGQVVTVWVVVFNNPEHCATTPCTFADMANPDRPGVQSDFLYGGGHIIGGSGRGNFGGRLRVGDTSGSGLAEVGGTAVGLLYPETAEIHLALHSHGPAVPGQILKEQLTTFLGGCQTFLGPDGLADGPEDMPVTVGECSTFQASIHLP